jgi:two-component system cell cycle response regulator
MSDSSYRVLFVDDSPEDLALYRRLLTRENGAPFQIVEATSADEALRICQAQNLDCLILDYRLPDHDGLELLREFSNPNGVPKLPVIMLTGQGDESVAVEAMKSGAQDYLVKGKITEDVLRRAIMNAIDKVGLLQHIEEQRRELERLAITDGLTGLYNYRWFMERLEQEVTRVRRFSFPLAVLLIDLDHFKQVNDTYGHMVGDKALIEVATAIKDSLRRTDWAARYGGEEFCILAVGANAEGACVFGNRLRERVALQPISVGHEKNIQVTCSIGVAQLDSSTADARALLQRADEALYEAKRKGRNNVVCAGC